MRRVIAAVGILLLLLVGILALDPGVARGHDATTDIWDTEPNWSPEESWIARLWRWLRT
jgi:hypothetical protein